MELQIPQWGAPQGKSLWWQNITVWKFYCWRWKSHVCTKPHRRKWLTWIWACFTFSIKMYFGFVHWVWKKIFKKRKTTTKYFFLNVMGILATLCFYAFCYIAQVHKKNQNHISVQPWRVLHVRSAPLAPWAPQCGTGATGRAVIHRSEATMVPSSGCLWICHCGNSIINPVSPPAGPSRRH